MIFKKKKEQLTAETLHNTLVLLDVEHMKKFIPLKNKKAIKMDLEKLRICGLGGTKNAQILRGMQENDESKLAREIKEKYPNALIVPYSDLFRVMKEYNLAVGKIEHYNKLIPEENVKQIYEASMALQNLFLNDFRYIKEISINSDLPKSTVKRVVEYVSRFPLIKRNHDYDYSANFLVPKDELRIEDADRHLRIETSMLSGDDWLIAAPVQDVPENTVIRFFSSKAEERKRILEDPIVFKASKIGAVIVSMWGEEANSEIFDKYRN